MADPQAMLAGTLPALYGYVWTTLELDGDLPSITGSFDVAPQLAGTLPAVEGAFSCYPDQPGYLAGELPALTGTFASPGTYAIVHGRLTGITGAFTGLSGNLATFTGTIGAIEGDFTSTRVISISALNDTVPALSGNFAATWTGTNLLAGDLPAITSSFYVQGTALAKRTVVMNLANYGVTHYEGFNFDSLAHYGDVLLGANESGLYLIGGDTDLGAKIEAEVQSGRQDLAAKIPREVWMAYRSDGDAIFTIKTDKGLDVYEYTFVPKTIMSEGRAKIGKGIKGRFFIFGLKNKSGTRLHVNLLRVFGDLIKRLSR
jgi:hypothetical protein